VGPKIISRTKYVTPCRNLQPVSSTHYRGVCHSYLYIRRCVLTKCKLLYELGIYTGASCCVVKLPDEVYVSHTKRVGEIKKLYNYSSQSAAH